jgi:hypothetical protein
MPQIKPQPNGLWSVWDGDDLVANDLTNSKAWRIVDLASREPVSASQVAKEFSEPQPRATPDEMQDFFSGLLWIASDRGYKDGWAWHKFHEKFGCIPEGLHHIAFKPSKQVWGWLNRKAIAAAKK